MQSQLNLRSSRVSWAERYHYAIAVGLTVAGFAAVGAIRLVGEKGSLATVLAAFGAFALYFPRGFVRSEPIFPASEINRQNRWKYLILAAVLWGTLALVWWYRVRPIPLR